MNQQGSQGYNSAAQQALQAYQQMQGQQGAQQATQAVQQGANQLLQHPQVQQALQSIGQFLGRIGHPLAGQFNQMHGIGGQGIQAPGISMQQLGQAMSPQQPSPAQIPYQPISMQQLGQAAGGK